ncbi:MAG: VOC family protein [Rhodospirillales bacterium]
MPDTHGQFVWYELMTTDTAAGGAFYGAVVGWDRMPAGIPGMDYTMFAAGGVPTAGLMTLPDDLRAAGAPPGWIGYVAVDDVDAAAAKAVGLGGAVHHAPADLPGVGRFAAIADPQGAALVLFKASSMPQTPAPPRGTPGHVAWRELFAADWPQAAEFYGAMFGWTKADAIDIGEMGTYQLFAAAAGAEPVGGMFNKPAMVPACFWLYYICVADFDAAVGRVTAGGGTVVNGPMEVPGGDWIVQCFDPQGAMFALVGKRG